ncbi:hypothetical protein M3E13_15490 [Oceanobacillus kimchii]|uniref:hypothetical protein n=1 Tax=Oceanobacillus kimchii TaxID=746691 RepID=UPI0021A62626|nr:hypothetical protein [Oceanobacillus kimchii]MCT1575668.1 hypothetical protein [Oceanobacillus kimchii]MCT2137299.1 hypothetical protein [Oceanobacillus kimchii]
MKSIKDVNILKSQGIEQVGSRTCETCKNTVPIYERKGERYSVCLTCENTKLAKQQTDGYEPLKRREMANKAKAINHIPQELENVTFEDYVPKTNEQSQAMNLVQELIQGNHQAIVLQGDPGTGKSHLFRCAARELEKQKVSWTGRDWQGKDKEFQVNKIVIFAKIPELMKLIQSTYKGQTSLTESTILETIKDADVLILDEIAGERSKSDNGFETWSGDITYQILDSRQGKCNLYNLNYSSAEVKKKYGETHGKRILSRMASGAKILQVKGPDHRMEGLK